MHRRHFLALAGPLLLAATALAQKKPDRLSGHIQTIDTGKKEIKMRMSTTQAIRTIMYDDNTKFTMEKKPAGADALKDGLRIVATGKFEGNDLKADNIALYLK